MATYDAPGARANGTPAMILFRYGKGRVFLSGPHLEISFDNCNLYYDNETWQFMDRIIPLVLGE